jgi:aspartate/methionine/tyrosine aminotransferase
MDIEPFALERYFARHEFSARYLLSCSDCEPLSLAELVAMADAESLESWRELRLGYTESAGHPLLREAIAGLYPGLTPDETLVAAPEEAIFLFMHAILERGDHVVCTVPAYQSLHAVARSIGCEVSSWEPDEGRGWSFDHGALESLLRTNTRLVVVNFPHNPTGYVPSRADFEALVGLVHRRGIHLLSDEMYRFLDVEPGSALPAACELSERAHSLGGLSKAFGLPGLRVGWIATHDRRLIGRLAELKDYTTICASAPSEVLAIIALRQRPAIVERHLGCLRRNVTLLGGFLGDRDDLFAWNPPRGGSVCFPRLLFTGDAQAFCDTLVEQAGIMLVPSTTFACGNRHVRIGFGRENLPEVLHHFGDYLDRFVAPRSRRSSSGRG